ncbi:hypothetical protein ACHAQA_007457 [Verticillium albo-atrum]
MATMTSTTQTQVSVSLEAQGRASLSGPHELALERAETTPGRTFHPVYSKFTNTQKKSITYITAVGSLLASMSTTSIFAAVPEITASFDTTPTVVNISNAVYMVVMGLAACFWGPFADVFGRKTAYILSTVFFLASSIGTALSPTLPAFFLFRILTGAQATAYLILGSSCISDVFHPVERATAMGWFLRGVAFGPAFGPVIGGIVVTYTSWRVIFWVQSALSGIALLLVTFLLHETLQQPRWAELKGQEFGAAAKTLWRWANPATVFKLLGQKNLFCVAFASSAIGFNMYALLTPIRYILNPRLGLSTPLQSGLLYLAPGAGYLVGTALGGRWSDHMVKSWMHRRGFRLWEDRLRSTLLFTLVLLPGCTLLYGWTVHAELGGIALPVVCLFAQGVCQTTTFPSLNAYILDVMQDQSGKASASHYFMRYCFSAVATASIVPMIDAIGVGWATTISSASVVLGGALVVLVIHFGGSWRGAGTGRGQPA